MRRVCEALLDGLLFWASLLVVLVCLAGASRFFFWLLGV